MDILFILIKPFASIVIIVEFYIFFSLNYLLMFSNSSFVIDLFFLILLAWSHKRCYVISIPYRSFQIYILLLYPFTGLPSSSAGLLKK